MLHTQPMTHQVTPPQGILRRVTESLPPVHNVDTGKIALGYRTLIAIIAACALGYGAYLTVSLTATGAATAITTHSEDRHPHPDQFNTLNDKIDAIKTDTQEAKAQAISAKETSTRTEKQVGAIDAKIDFLIQNELERAQDRPGGMQRARRAASTVRHSRSTSAGEANDPLIGIDGL